MILTNTYSRSSIKGYDALQALALDMNWSWNHRTDKVWRHLSPSLWDLTHNPWVILQTVSREKLEEVLADQNFRQIVDDLLETSDRDKQSPAWFQKTYPEARLSHVAYFCMEFMLSEALPIYSGGLGNVAGDQLKAASDLGVPVVAVGLLYQQGYFRQMIDKNGMQKAFYPYNDPGQLPITPLRKADGEWLRIEIALPGWSVWLRTWQVKVGRLRLYLLDSNDLANFPAHRGITSELYGGDSELRLKQELILGIGGWRLLTALGIKPEVCHLNEGHAAFAVLERARNFMVETGHPFEVALAATRSSNLFTTHTAVRAGFDLFSPLFIEQYLGHYANKLLHIPIEDLLALGRQNPQDANEYFNMAYLAVRGSGSVNGVSLLHGKVSRKIFLPLFPRWPEEEVPIGHVTNGVHMPSWDSAAADQLWTEACGKDRWLGSTENLEKSTCHLPDDKIWQMRNEGRQALIEYAHERLARQLEARADPQDQIGQVRSLFNPHKLTLGFARRFATYKRPNMLIHDPDRLLRILKNPQWPVQLIFAGKAHPDDHPGQQLIQEWMTFIRTPEWRPHVIFLSDDDMLLTEKLVQGVDVWINTPRRPWEACGTSGMKVLVNGGINLSELDGWWAEAYTPAVGWAIGDGNEHADHAVWDAKEATQLYDLLENEVIPLFYSRDENNFPTAWIERIRASMSQLTPRFSANRAVCEYTERYYLPAAEKYAHRSANQCLLATQILDWQHALKQNWPALRFKEVKIETVGGEQQFQVQVYLHALLPSAVKVELYANGVADHPPQIEEMSLIEPCGENLYLYRRSLPSTLAAAAYTARIVPHFPDVSIPLEANQILWQR